MRTVRVNATLVLVPELVAAVDVQDQPSQGLFEVRFLPIMTPSQQWYRIEAFVYGFLENWGADRRAEHDANKRAMYAKAVVEMERVAALLETQ